MQTNQTPSTFKSGFVSVMGRPNVGKSTLINKLLEQKITAVSPRPQTTRKRQLGILTSEHSQIIFIDTPGIHNPRHKLGNKMNEEAKNTLQDCDLILFVVDASEPPTEEDQTLSDIIAELNPPVQTLLVINKIDRLEREVLASRENEFSHLLPDNDSISVSSIYETNLDILLAKVEEHLPLGPSYYPEDQVTDIYERDIAADMVRVAALHLLRDEVPHGIAIRIDSFKERSDYGAYIEATILVERESHKGIVIGKGGKMLKKIGSFARTEIEKMTGRKIYLRLWVKVRKNWRNDENMLNRFGY